VIDPAKRDDRLLQLLAKHHSSRRNRIIIFVLYKKEAPRVEALLKRKGWNATAIHGDISQAQRTAAVEAFKAGTVPLLIATDVAARGLDIPDVEVGGGCGARCRAPLKAVSATMRPAGAAAATAVPGRLPGRGALHARFPSQAAAVWPALPTRRPCSYPPPRSYPPQRWSSITPSR
jgi:hypothetical protein